MTADDRPEGRSRSFSLGAIREALVRRKTVPSRVVSYRYNNGGLNNQKLALLGLFLEGRRNNLPIALPDLYNLDHNSPEGHRTVGLTDVYQAGPLLGLANRHGIAIDPGKSSDDVGGWDYFGIGSKYIAAKMSDRSLAADDLACDFFRSLVPVARISTHVEELRRRVFHQDAISLVIQMRIEKDWQRYAQITLKPTVGSNEEYLPEFSIILAKVLNTFGSQHRRAYVVCDEATLSVPLDEIRETSQRVFGLSLTWKSDVIGRSAVDGMSIIERSVVDFDMAMSAPNFVGLTRSSFSNLATFERYCQTGATVTGHYIYNLPGPYLRERHDNGAFAFATAAVAPAL